MTIYEMKLLGGLVLVIATVIGIAALFLLPIAPLFLPLPGMILAGALGYLGALLFDLRAPIWSVPAAFALQLVAVIAAFSQYNDDAPSGHTFDVLLFIAARPIPLALGLITGIAIGHRTATRPGS
jgi:hypothetical protein